MTTPSRSGERSLWILRGADGTEIELPLGTQDRVTIGRELSSDVTLLDPGISRHHATIARTGGLLTIEDLHSNNGTYVNSERVHRAEIRAGDVITLGRLHWTLLSRSDPQARRPHGLAALEAMEALPAELLRRLLELERELGLIQSLRQPYQYALERVRTFFQADRCAVFSRDPHDPHGGRLIAVAAAPAGEFHAGDRTSAWPLPSPLAREVFEREQRDAALGSDASWQDPSPRSEGSESPRAEGARASYESSHHLAAPIYFERRLCGVIELERLDPQRPFEAVDLQLLTAAVWVNEGALGALLGASCSTGIGGAVESGRKVSSFIETWRLPESERASGSLHSFEETATFQVLG